MKNNPYHSWKAPCSFRVAAEYMVPSRIVTDNFSSVYSGTENWAGLIFITDMPVRQGSRRMPARCIHGDAGENTDDPRAMTQDGPCCDP